MSHHFLKLIIMSTEIKFTNEFGHEITQQQVENGGLAPYLMISLLCLL